MERIEPETEIHRFQKAIKRQLNARQEDDILFQDSTVSIGIDSNVVRSRGGQFCLALMVNLLARMKAAIQTVYVPVPFGILVQSQVPLYDRDLRAGLEQLVQSVNGPDSVYPVAFDFDSSLNTPTVSVAIGMAGSAQDSVDIRVEANAWTAYINAVNPKPNWHTEMPFGPHMAATLAVAEVFKHLLIRNFPNETKSLHIKLLNDVEFCALTIGADPGEEAYPSTKRPLLLNNIAIAGVGAGGAAALYTLASMPHLEGRITLIEPGCHKPSNLTRYLLSSYQDCHERTSKLDVATEYLHGLHPGVEIQPEALPYDDVADRSFRIVVSTVDTLEGRWDIQRDNPPIILDAAVVESIYAILRVYPGQGMCLGCKHPYDPERTWKRRARMWGKTYEEVRELARKRALVTLEDVERLAFVQGQSVDRYLELIGMPFDEVPSRTECGDTKFDLQVPNQAATIPFVTTMAGILIAVEIVKEQIAPALAVHNWFEHNMLWVPKSNRHRFRPRLATCRYCERIEK